MTFYEFEELFLEKRIDRRMVGAYFEWAGLVHAYRRYVESGEFDYVPPRWLALELSSPTPSNTPLISLLLREIKFFGFYTIGWSEKAKWPV